MKIVSSREFNQDVSSAKRFARSEPVFVTDRGRPTHVLLSIDAFRQLSGHSESMVDLLAMPDAGDMELDAARSGAAWDRVPEHR
ncbi:MAG: type II toxin-antitoxin system Phd/YefM family antitoxin [Sphingomonas sp.]|uniref:type II toxin-antitoxin system Phd/YefM family antitoxin n=1 Tax=Sphingomonas sp. TaxID=28214 RepID=UPI0025F1545A|nr:type II toxin-antitoxin system Phd/YefM family antitoxin [Sphingomonas sp.]MBX3564269.1 type II toxin-antitoxin system Phd/YefM family antitoxin [Sphingomonas sp.]